MEDDLSPARGICFGIAITVGIVLIVIAIILIRG